MSIFMICRLLSSLPYECGKAVGSGGGGKRTLEIYDKRVLIIQS